MNTDNDSSAALKPQEPVKVLQDFLAAHSASKVRLVLLAALQGYALNENKGFLELDVNEEEIAALFDHLVELVNAVQELSAQGKIIGIRR